MRIGGSMIGTVLLLAASNSLYASQNGDIFCSERSMMPHHEWNDFLQLVLQREVTQEQTCTAFQVEEEWFLEILSGYMVRMCNFDRRYRILLLDIWNDHQQKHPPLAWEILNRETVRISLAGALHQCDKKAEYREYVLSQLSAAAAEVRLKAVMGMALVGREEDVDLLSEIAMSSDEALAQQAGIAIRVIRSRAEGH